jgi:hypothetical protein
MSSVEHHDALVKRSLCFAEDIVMIFFSEVQKFRRKPQVGSHRSMTYGYENIALSGYARQDITDFSKGRTRFLERMHPISKNYPKVRIIFVILTLILSKLHYSIY